jgi:hypothetical protein
VSLALCCASFSKCCAPQSQAHWETDSKACCGALSDFKTSPEILTRLPDKLNLTAARVRWGRLCTYQHHVHLAFQLCSRKRHDMQIVPFCVASFRWCCVKTKGDNVHVTLCAMHLIRGVPESAFAIACAVWFLVHQLHTETHKHAYTRTPRIRCIAHNVTCTLSPLAPPPHPLKPTM